MLQERDVRWKQAVEDGNTVPAFIQKIQKYATGLHVSAAHILLRWLCSCCATNLEDRQPFTHSVGFYIAQTP